MTHYPFTAIVGMADLRLALLLNAVSPAVGGVLVRGEKGTAKSTAVRALAALLPDVATVAGCRFSCDPDRPDPACPDGPHPSGAPAETRAARMVELPVGAGEDRLAGSLDIERALAEGVKAFEPGLLAAAHRGILYVDEVNLLHDHLVDLLLDAAASGTSTVEREGVSVRHAARFLLVGTMNPEEGELRPQLLDRFGLTVEVAASRDTDQRVEVVRRRLAFEDAPDAFAAHWAPHEAELAARVRAARALLPCVVLGDAALRQIAAVCAAFEVDGMRADLVTARTATALAAWAGRTEVTAEDVRQAALLSLPHRRRRNPFDAPGLDEERLDEVLERHAPPPPPSAGSGTGEPAGSDGAEATDGPEDDPDGDGPGPGGGGTPRGDVPPPRDGEHPETGPGADAPDPAGGHGADHSADRGADPRPGAADGTGGAHGDAEPDAATAEPDAPYRTRLFQVSGLGTGADGRRSRARTDRGRAIGARRPDGPLSHLHLAATIRAAAPHQAARGRTGPGLVIRRDDLREQVREGREGNLVLFVVDASGSMAARQRLGAVKGAVLSLLLDAYQRRDKIGMITFRGTGAEVALPPTSSVEAGAARLRALRTGGRTPLAAGLLRAAEVLRVERLRDPHRRPLLVAVTDGRATGPGDPLREAGRAARLLAAGGVGAIVLDCESGPVRLGLAGVLARDLGGEAVRLEQLHADGVASVVRQATANTPGAARGAA
ncbi:putative cobaltochelatase [Allostreptomyces psammosilenae]|uniref:Mg-protoporphyrin IX chelatase n=1 Tax=Allostreptomyces psammosilenae TaxID=1892865 RepID=A0A852ZP27_9ACTN|nr:putative cobaltochelatase [Allostreptomyces psammosilenae]NYI04129.1 magnesium chelatase subunit D [Allostreptomyces psammosilenae]